MVQDQHSGTRLDPAVVAALFGSEGGDDGGDDDGDLFEDATEGYLEVDDREEGGEEKLKASAQVDTAKVLNGVHPFPSSKTDGNPKTNESDGEAPRTLEAEV